MEIFSNRAARVSFAGRWSSIPFALLPGLFLLLFSLPNNGHAHPVSLTSVFVNAEDEKITAELNMLTEDLILYYWMDTNDEFRFPAETIKEQAREHKDFLARHFHVRDRDGNRLEGEIVDIDFSEIGEDGVHIDELMAHSIRYHFEFPFEERPEFVTVSQDFGGEEPPVPAEMGVRFFHHGVHLESVMLSHHTAHTVHLDWDAGWEAARDDLEGARERLRERQEETLGITSYSTVYSYLYLTDTEVRHEVLIPLLTLESWLPLERENDEIMSIEEQRRARDGIITFFEEHNSVQINGVDVRPELDRLHFFGPEFRDFAQQAPERPVSVYNARVGVILSFPAAQTPRRLTFSWDYFDERLPVFRPKVYLFDDDATEFALHSGQTEWEWETDRTPEPITLAELPDPEPIPRLHLPLLSLVGGGGALFLLGATIWPGPNRRRLTCGGLAVLLAGTAVATLPYARMALPHPFQPPPELEQDEAEALFQSLHQNIYAAFAFRDKERIYDALDQSVAGPLLEELYLQIRQNLSVQEQGGAVSRVQNVELLEGEIEPVSPTQSGTHQQFAYRSSWTVTGTVEHWGHVHTRTNRYEARFIVEGLPHGWRITGFDPLHEERVEMQVRLRQ